MPALTVTHLSVTAAGQVKTAASAELEDVQAAIEEKKKLLAEKEATLRRTLGRSKAQTLDPLDDSTLPRQDKVCSCHLNQSSCM